MKITVLNGSPKGQKSVTMQYVNFIQKKFPRHNLEFINISQRIKKIEQDEALFREIIDTVRSSDGILWAFPLYFLAVPSQYKRFIELVFERGAAGAFKDKYTSVLTTSIHFYDHTAHNYMNAICDDLNMKYTGNLSPKMYDLEKKNGQATVTAYAQGFFDTIENNLSTPQNYSPVIHNKFVYTSQKKGGKTAAVDPGNKKIIIVSDHGKETKEHKNLAAMIERFRNSFSGETELVNLNDIDIKGGCLGCCQCGYNYTCVYEGKDGFIDFYNTKIKPADIVIFAGSIKDRYLSSLWKTYFDRSFFNNHTPTLVDKQIGFLISGPLRQIPNLRQIMEGYLDCQSAHVVDFITDESENAAQIDQQLQSFAQRLVMFSDMKYVKPQTFLGVGGFKIFRDDIWGELRFVWQADHRYYKKHGKYDFPQKKYGIRLLSALMMVLTKIPPIRKEFYTKMLKPKMIEPLEKVLKKV
ncbi:MAG: flavodoxin [bacterium]|nr:flavodoxin [bacterium]